MKSAINKSRDPLIDMINARSSGLATIPQHASIACLAFYLFLDFKDEEDRIRQAHSLFFEFDTHERMPELISELEKDPPAYGCYLQAITALNEEKIEAHYEEPEPSPLVMKAPPAVERAYTASFLIWAENAGLEIPEYVLRDTRIQLELYFHGKHSRDQHKLDFPTITAADLLLLSKEPLWTLAAAVLYINGHLSAREEKAALKFIEGNKKAQKLIAYVKDAKSANILKCPGEPVNDSPGDWLLNIKVVPTEFIAWAKTLPMDFPILSENADQDLPPQIKTTDLSTRERASLLKMIIAMAVKGYAYDPSAARSTTAKEIASDLALSGMPMDEDTVRKWLREAAELLPADTEKS